MKRCILVVISIILTILVIFIAIFRLENSPFSLDPEYYNSSEVQSIDMDTLDQLIRDKKSFGLFVSQVSCQASADLAKYLQEFTNTHHLKFYEINYSTLRDSNTIPDLHFYPSFAIFRNGEIVDFLEANSDEDTEAYSSAAGFKTWFTQYVQIDQ